MQRRAGAVHDPAGREHRADQEDPGQHAAGASGEGCDSIRREGEGGEHADPPGGEGEPRQGAADVI